MNLKNIVFRRKAKLRKLAFAISICTFLFSAIMLIGRAIDAHKTKDINKQLSKIQEEIDSIQTTDSDNDMPDNNEALKRIDEEIDERKSIEAVNKDAEIENQIQSLKKVNSDIKGWIRIDNTQISNPIVQTADNSFYLEHDVNKNKNRYGAIFIDMNNDVSDPKKLEGQNIILYGHHMKDGTMFGSLKRFRNSEFFKAKDIIEIDIFPKNYKFQVFGVYMVNQDLDYRNTKLGSEEDIKSLLKRLKDKRLQYRDITLSPKDTILTLSTCAYDFKDARLVLMARLLTD